MNTPHALRKAALSVMPLLALLVMAVGFPETARAGVVLDTTFTSSGCESDTCVGQICFVAQEHIVVRSEGANKCGIHIDLHGTATGPNGEQYQVSATENVQGDCSGGCQDVVFNAHIIGKGSTPNLVLHIQQTVCPSSVTTKTKIACH